MTAFDFARLDELSDEVIKTKLPSFYVLLGQAIKSLIEDKSKRKGKGSPFALFGLWSVVLETSGKLGEPRYSARSTWRARKLAKSLIANGPEDQEVLSVLHRHLLQSEGLNILVSRIQLISKRENSPPEMSVGANIVFLLRYVFESIMSELYGAEDPVIVPGLGLFWIGNRHRFLAEPKYHAGGAIQFEPSFS